MKPSFTIEEVLKLNPEDDLPNDISHLSDEEKKEHYRKREECLKALDEALILVKQLREE